MRYLLMISALVLLGLIAIRFVDRPETRRSFEDRRVILIAGGKLGDPFQIAVSAGVDRAERDLGCDVTILCSDWDPARLTSLFQQEMAGVPDGICLFGDPLNEELTPLIEDAVDEGIVVTSYQRRFPTLQATYSAQGFGFAGPDLYRAGHQLIDAAVKKHGLVAGDQVMLVHDPGLADPEGLYGGVTAAIQQSGLILEVVEVSAIRPGDSGDHVRSHLSASRERGKVPALLCNLDTPMETCLHVLRAEGFQPGELPLVGIGPEPYVYDLLRNADDNLSLVIAQDLSVQAYLAVLQVCLGREYTAFGPQIATPYRIVDRDAPVKTAENESAPFIQVY